MKEAYLAPGIALCSDTYYRFDGDILDVSLSDTQHITDRTYLSLTAFHRGCLDTAFYLHHLKNVVLDFGGATLYLRGRLQPFILDGCENVTIRNVTVEYDRAFYSEFDVVSNTNGELRLHCRPNFPCRVENGYLIPYANTWENRTLHIGDMFVQAFDRETREEAGWTVAAIGEEIKLKDTPPCHVEHLRVREEDGDIVLLGTVPAHWNDSHIVALSHETRDKSSAFLCRSKNITIENYRILNGAGYGITSMYCENIKIDGLKLTHDERSHGILANSADAIHLIATKGHIEIVNSVIEGMFDDALNIHTNFYLAHGVQDGKLCAYKGPESYFCDAYYQIFGPGDVIRITRGQTLEEKCTCRIRSIEVVDACNVLLETDGDPACVEYGDLIENLSTQPSVRIADSRFGCAISHLRLQTRGAVIVENCVTALPLLFTGDTTYWFEASPNEHAIVRGNRFVGGRARVAATPEYRASEAAPYYHRGIAVVNNVFDSALAMTAHDSADITFTGNTCSDGTTVLQVHLERCGGELLLDGCIEG